MSAVAARTRRPAMAAAAGFGGLAVLLEVPYPLVTGRVRNLLTVAAVLAFFTASTLHAAATRGPRWAARLVAVAAGGGLLAEAVGTAAGWPFGRYSYAGSLGPRLFGVPVVIPLAWAMMAYPALLIARRLTATRPRRALVGGVALASWDLFLDPQMVTARHWRWVDPTPHLPGVPGVPLSNYLGWLVVAVGLLAVLDAALADPARDQGRHEVRAEVRAEVPDDRLPLALYCWTYASSVLANLAFFGRPQVALWGGLAMGAVLLALARDGRPWRAG